MHLTELNTENKNSKKVLLLHIVDTYSHFQKAIFLSGESARDVWAGFIEA